MVAARAARADTRALRYNLPFARLWLWATQNNRKRFRQYLEYVLRGGEEEEKWVQTSRYTRYR